MGYWMFMLAIVLMIPVIMALCGLLFLGNPPKSINSFVGYRTRMSMKNQDTWNFAHAYCGRLWRWVGLGMLPVSVAPMLFAMHGSETLMAVTGLAVCFVQTIVMLYTIVPTERALKQNFDENGQKKPVVYTGKGEKRRGKTEGTRGM